MITLKRGGRTKEGLLTPARTARMICIADWARAPLITHTKTPLNGSLVPLLSYHIVLTPRHYHDRHSRSLAAARMRLLLHAIVVMIICTVLCLCDFPQCVRVDCPHPASRELTLWLYVHEQFYRNEEPAHEHAWSLSTKQIHTMGNQPLCWSSHPTNETLFFSPNSSHQPIGIKHSPWCAVFLLHFFSTSGMHGSFSAIASLWQVGRPIAPPCSVTPSRVVPDSFA
jgi:hypothetical protein